MSDSDSDFSVSGPLQKKPRKESKVSKPKSSSKNKAERNGSANGENGLVSATEDPMEVFTNIDDGKQKLTIEKIYQKKTQLEHILIRPETYIGSVQLTEKSPAWVYDSEKEMIVLRDIAYVPGLYKIFDEILVNAADNKQRDPKMNLIKINIDKEKNEICIFNNGKGIPVVHHKIEDMYVPELIFGTLLTSSNYDDTERKVTGGRNGYGAKLCNIFSTEFTVETSSKEYGKVFKQV
ncbi:hypothetical protein AB6A40_010559 [Gnathostoma spinigerum]|uniref:Histidine kinase/HSP90-like ATPase domain-containing protein n=1 Tax=Gnathostoma spinigerum TaxID=75299 RepID=A0ABD6F3G7_9BILA